MKARFTLCELLLAVSLAVVLGFLLLGMTPRDKARSVRCADKLRALLAISHRYVSDHRGMWMAPCSTKNGAYVRSLSAGKYLKSSWKTLMTARETEITCPELPRVSRYRTMQGYGAVYNNGSSYDPQLGIYIYSPEYAFIGTGRRRRPVAWAKRIWFADTLNLLKPPYPSPLLFGHLPGYPKGSEVFGAVDLTHGGKANIAAVDGSVAAVAPDELKGYYFPVTGGKPLRHYSAPLRMYLDHGTVRGVKR